MRLAAFACALALAATPLAAQEPAAFPSWMAGAWALTDGERWTEEFWTQPRGGVMLGASREGQGETLRTWEAIRIVRKPDGTLAYVPMPNGGAPVEFAMVRQDGQSIEFANPAHDFPQRIRYWREGDTLHAEIALIDGSRAIAWSYAPIGELRDRLAAHAPDRSHRLRPLNTWFDGTRLVGSLSSAGFEGDRS